MYCYEMHVHFFWFIFVENKTKIAATAKTYFRSNQMTLVLLHQWNQN